MSKKRNTALAESSAARAEVQDPAMDMNEKRCNEMMDLAMSAGRGMASAIKENSGDYKAIEEDETLNSVEKALGKRKVLFCDMALGAFGFFGTYGMVCLARRLGTAISRG